LGVTGTLSGSGAEVRFFAFLILMHKGLYRIASLLLQDYPLSGAAAITTTISALGGLSLIIGGAAFVASGTAFVIWLFLKSGKTRDSSVLHQLETRTYTYTENTIPGDLGEFIQKNVRDKYKSDKSFSDPNIPLDKLSHAVSAWLSVYPDEKVIALIDTSGFLKNAGVLFTDGRLLWTNKSSDYKDLAKFLKTEIKLCSLLSDDKQKKELSELKKVVEILSDEKYATNLSNLQDLVAITSNDEKLGELVSNDKYKNQFSQLKYAVDIFSNEKYSKNLSKLKDVVNILSNGQDLVKNSPAQLVSQLSDEQYRKDLSNLKEVVDMFYNESDKENLSQLLR
jgi:hypothetical protein